MMEQQGLVLSSPGRFELLGVERGWYGEGSTRELIA